MGLLEFIFAKRVDKSKGKSVKEEDCSVDKEGLDCEAIAPINAESFAKAVTEIKTEIIEGVERATDFGLPTLPPEQQKAYDEILKKEALAEAKFRDENSVSEDEETQIIYFEVDYEKEINKHIRRCEEHDVDEKDFPTFCKHLEAFRLFCYSHGRIGQLYFEKNYGNYKADVEERHARHQYWANLPEMVQNFIKENSPVLQTDIWANFPTGISTVRQYVKNLEADGLITKERHGRSFIVTWIGK